MSSKGEDEKKKSEIDNTTTTNNNNNYNTTTNNNSCYVIPPHKLNSAFFAGGDSRSPSLRAGNDDFVWPELSSSGELPDNNSFPIKIYSIESISTDSTSNGAVSAPPDERKILGFEEKPLEKKLKDPDVVMISSDDEEDVELSEEGSSEEVEDEEFRAKLAGKVPKSSLAAMQCLIEVLKQLYVNDKEGNEEDVDILETVKRRGMTFPRPRGYDS